MNPIRDINEVLKNWDIFERNWDALFAFFLYTDEDRNLAAYVRTNFRSLDQLSGGAFLIFLIDQPPDRWREEARKRKYWGEFENRISNHLFQSKPYEKAHAYEIAKCFRVSPRSMPCVVFFKDIEARELLVCPINATWSDEQLAEFFREIFSVMDEEMKCLDADVSFRGANGPALKKDALWRELKSYLRQRRVQNTVVGVLRSRLVQSVGEVIKKLASHSG